MPYHAHMQHVIDKLGGPAKVARLMGCKPPSVIEWRKRGIPAERCPAFERETGRQGEPRHVELLRPDVPWHRVPDPDWPWHPAGRPLIDVARAASTAQAEVDHAA